MPALFRKLTPLLSLLSETILLARGAFVHAYCIPCMVGLVQTTLWRLRSITRVMVPDHTIGVLPLNAKYCVARSLLSTVCILNDAYVRTPDIAGTGQ